MTLTTEDRSFFTRALVLTGVGIVVALGALMLARSGPPHFIENPALPSGDTPVVLIGGSLTFKAGDSSYPWAPISGTTTYQATPNYAIKTIVVKQDTGAGGDGGAASDKLRVDVSNATSWEVDEYISPAGGSPAGTPDVEVASISGVSSAPNAVSPIYLKPVRGFLCPAPTGATTISAIKYGLTSGCPESQAPAPDLISFSKVSITVNGQPQPTATLACLGTSDPQGKCRIVFRGH